MIGEPIGEAAMETASFEAVKRRVCRDADRTRERAAMETASFEAVKAYRARAARRIDREPQWRPLLSKR